MTDDKHRKVGLGRRELERELRWMLRSPPADAAQLAKLLGEVIVALLDKNNAAIAAALAGGDDDKPAT